MHQAQSPSPGDRARPDGFAAQSHPDATSDRVKFGPIILFRHVIYTSQTVPNCTCRTRVPDGGEGEDMQEAFFQAKEATERASGDLAARRAQRRAAEEALGRVQEELRRAGEDTRPLADKRKRREQTGGGRGRGGEEQEEA